MIFCSSKFVDSSIMNATQANPISGIESSDIRLSSPNRVWSAPHLLFFCGGLRKFTIFFSKPEGDSRGNLPKS